MDTLSANEAKTNFGELLLRAQREPVQINKNGKPVAVVLSVEEYEGIETLKLRLLQARAMQAMADIEADSLVDGELFFNQLEAGNHDG
jgi:prevent-host-death family protein